MKGDQSVWQQEATEKTQVDEKVLPLKNQIRTRQLHASVSPFRSLWNTIVERPNCYFSVVGNRYVKPIANAVTMSRRPNRIFKWRRHSGVSESWPWRYQVRAPDQKQWVLLQDVRASMIISNYRLMLNAINDLLSNVRIAKLSVRPVKSLELMSSCNRCIFRKWREIFESYTCWSDLE